MEMESLSIDPKNPVSPTTSGYRLPSRFSDGKNHPRCSNVSLVFNNNNNENLLPTVTIQSDDDVCSRQRPKNLLLFHRALKLHQNLESTSIISKSIDHQHFISYNNNASMKCLEKSAAVERNRRRHRRTISSSDDNEECCCSSSYSNDNLIPNSITLEEDNSNRQPLLLFEGEKIAARRNGVLPVNLHKIEFIDDQTTDDDARLSFSEINGSSLHIGDFSMGLPQFKGKSDKLETVNENNCLTTTYNDGGGGAPGALANINNNNNGDSCTKLDGSGVAGTQGQNTPLLRAKFLQRKLAPFKRLVEKSGECNVSLCNVKRQKLKYVTDIFTTVVDMKWRWCLLGFGVSFFTSWSAFAVLYYLMMLMHRDFDHLDEAHWPHCIKNMRNFLSVFMFSVETQHTIGYGYRYPTEDCPHLVVTVCFQSVLGLMIQTLMTGVVFAKLARPKKRAATLVFSRHCCICMRDGKLCLLFRVGDMRKSHLAEAHVRLQMISKKVTDEGELLPFHQFDMNVGYDLGLDRIFVVWPITICHVIDENSPLYEYSAEILSTSMSHFEIVAILEGVVPSTGSTTQARTSYLPCEILWGHRFEKLVTYQRDNGTYKIDFGKFDNVYPVDTPTLSAKEVSVLAEAGLNFCQVYQNNENEPADQKRESTAPPTLRSFQYASYGDAAPNGGDAAPVSPTSLKIVYDDARRQSIFDILNRHRLQSFDYAPLPLTRRRSSSNFEGSCQETDADPTGPKGHPPLNRGVSDGLTAIMAAGGGRRSIHLVDYVGHQNFLGQPAAAPGSLLSAPSGPYRKMSTMSNKLDRLIPNLLLGSAAVQGPNGANQNNSLKSLANTTNASAISLAICKEKQSSLMREHDIM